MSKITIKQSIGHHPSVHNSKLSQITHMSESTLHKTEGSTDFYKIDPLQSSFSCYPCQKLKRKSSPKAQTLNKRKRNLGMAKLDEVIIKPWHPFLRYLQGFFKGEPFKKTKEDNKLFLDVLEHLRNLRAQLINSQEMLEKVRDLTQQERNPLWRDQVKLADQVRMTMEDNLLILKNFSLDKLEEGVLKPDWQKFEDTKCRLKVQILEQQLRNAQSTVQQQNKTLDSLQGNVAPSLKGTLTQIIELQKSLQNLTKQNEILIVNEELYRKEYMKLKEENYLLYFLVRQDRNQLYQDLMKLYPQEGVAEAEVSYFDSYIVKYEQEIQELKLANRRLALNRSQDNFDKDIVMNPPNSIQKCLEKKQDQWTQTLKFAKLKISPQIEMGYSYYRVKMPSVQIVEYDVPRRPSDSPYKHISQKDQDTQTVFHDPRLIQSRHGVKFTDSSVQTMKVASDDMNYMVIMQAIAIDQLILADQNIQEEFQSTGEEEHGEYEREVSVRALSQQEERLNLSPTRNEDSSEPRSIYTSGRKINTIQEEEEKEDEY